MTQRVSTEEIVAAYRETGSVWAAGKKVGMAGQSVHERLRQIDYPLRGRRWTSAEREEMRELVANGNPIGEIARRLGRPYGSVATKLSEAGLTRGRGRQMRINLPRGAGFDKETTARRLRLLERYDGSLRQFCRANGLRIENFVVAVQKHFPERWDAYAAAHSDLPRQACGYCGGDFIPMNGKQEYCRRKCAADARADRNHFGGHRREAVGMEEGICQLCLQQKERGLSAHHVVGKENDPENEHLVALCPGCHKIVTLLASRKFVRDETTWEWLIGLALARADGKPRSPGYWVCVDIEMADPEEDEEDEA